MIDHLCSSAMAADKKTAELLANMPGMVCVRCGVTLGAYLIQSERINGDVVEFGCNEGHTAAFLASLTQKRLWLYDSFKGLPEKGDKDISFCNTGDLAVSPDRVTEYFDRYGLKQPTIVAKWFNEVSPDELPEHIAFAHLDGDFYQSILDSLKLVYPRLVPGSVCVIHDYDSSLFQGVKPAVEDYFGLVPLEHHPQQMFVGAPGQLVIIR